MSNNSDSPVVLITGANSGVGLALAKRLVADFDGHITLVLGCRNPARATQARDAVLLASDATPASPSSSSSSSSSSLRGRPVVELLQIDVASPQSILQASREFQARFKRLDLLYLNAGVMPVNGINWGNFIASPTVLARRFVTGEGFLKQSNFDTADGLAGVFASNVLGHFMLAQELLPVLSKQPSAKIVWTSSDAANPRSLVLSDIQHRKGVDPYGASKAAIDLASLGINRKLARQSAGVNAGVTSFVTCPGLVTTQMTESFLHPIVWTLLIPILFLLRSILHNLTTVPFNGAEALVWLSHQSSASLPPQTEQPIKFKSRFTITGRRYVEFEKLKLDGSQADQMFDQLQTLATTFKQGRPASANKA